MFGHAPLASAAFGEEYTEDETPVDPDPPVNTGETGSTVRRAAPRFTVTRQRSNTTTN